MAPSSHIRCSCLERDSEKVAVSERLQRVTGRKCSRLSSLSDCEGQNYDAIFINLLDNYLPDIHLLLKLSRPHTCWVLYPIKKGTTKHFWDEIVHDVRARITFDLKDTGIVFLRPDLHKEHYLV